VDVELIFGGIRTLFGGARTLFGGASVVILGMGVLLASSLVFLEILTKLLCSFLWKSQALHEHLTVALVLVA